MDSVLWWNISEIYVLLFFSIIIQQIRFLVGKGIDLKKVKQNENINVMALVALGILVVSCML